MVKSLGHTAFLVLGLILGLAGILPLFGEAYLTAKLTGLAILVLVSLAVSFRDSFWLPANRFLLAGLAAYLLYALLVTSLNTGIHNAVPEVAYWISLVVIFVLALNLSPTERNYLVTTIIVISFLQALLVFVQHLFEHIGTLHIIRVDGIVGTVGNSEFLSTLLAVAALLGFSRINNRVPYHIQFHSYVAATNICAIALLGSKGTLLILAIFAIWWKFRSPKYFYLLFALAITALLLYSPTSLFGRISLWVVAAWSGVAALPFGLGLRQFGNGYFDTLQELFVLYPSLSSLMGTYTSHVLDAHNLFLTQLNELGIVGLTLTLFVFIAIYRRLIAIETALSYSLLFLLLKMQYTVVLTSPVTAMIFCLLLGIFFGQEGMMPEHIRLRLPGRITFMGIGLFAFLGIGLHLASDYFMGRGMIEARAGLYESARESYSASARIKPAAYADLGIAFTSFNLSDHAVMTEYIERSLYQSRNMNTMKISAHMFYFSGNYEQARLLYEKINLVYPEHLTSLARLAQIHYIKKDLERALEYSRRVLETAPRIKSDSDTRNIRDAQQIIALSSGLITSKEY